MNTGFFRDANNIAKKMGLELVTYTSEASPLPKRGLGPDVDAEGSLILPNFSNALKEIIQKIDVLYIPFEFNEQIQVELRPEFIRTALKECLKYNVPIMTHGSYAKHGAPLSVWRDTDDMGRQTAELALKRLSQGPFTEPVIETPRTINCYINQSVASELGITFPKSVLDRAKMFGTEENEDREKFPFPRY